MVTADDVASSRAIIKCNLEQTAALISLDQGKVQVVDIAGTSPSQADRFDEQHYQRAIVYIFLSFSILLCFIF